MPNQLIAPRAGSSEISRKIRLGGSQNFNGCCLSFRKNAPHSPIDGFFRFTGQRIEDGRIYHVATRILHQPAVQVELTQGTPFAIERPLCREPFLEAERASHRRAEPRFAGEHHIVRDLHCHPVQLFGRQRFLMDREPCFPANTCEQIRHVHLVIEYHQCDHIAALEKDNL